MAQSLVIVKMSKKIKTQPQVQIFTNREQEKALQAADSLETGFLSRRFRKENLKVEIKYQDI